MDEEEEFREGYLDGRDAGSPEPNANRSYAYRHSFAVGRAEIAKAPIPANQSRRAAQIAIAKDQSL